MDLPNYLLIGSYLMGSASWLFLYRELKSMRTALTKELADLRLEMTREVALRVGQDHEARIARLERAMINAAQRVILCLDHTKFGRQSVSMLCDLECIDTVVTDSAATAELVEALRSRGLEVVVAGVDAPTAGPATAQPAALQS